MASNNPLVEAVPSEKFITPARGFANESSPPASSSASAGKASGAGGGEKGKEGKKDKKDKKKKGKKGMIDTAPCIGTRDFPPQEMIKRDWLFKKWDDIARTFNFQHYDAPMLEYEELYIRKAGEEITEQMYNFEDKGGRRVSLRPEMTPSLARLVLQAGRKVKLPLRWYSIPQCWRYEQPQKGRKREHYQWNMDVFGVPHVTAEAELLAAMCTFFKEVGLTSDLVAVKVSSRKVLQHVLSSLGVGDDLFAPVCVVVDKLDKLEASVIKEDLVKLGLSEDTAQQVINSLGTENTLDDLAKIVGEDSPAVQDLRDLFSLVDAYGISEYIVYDPSVVRGLAYYTGIVFEAFDKKGEFRAIAGGGRYDKLLSTFGGQDIPACGFGFGDCVIMELLAARKLLPAFTPAVDYVVLPWNEAVRGKATRVAVALRGAGCSVDLAINVGKNAKWLFTHADNSHAPFAVLVVDDELRLKDLKAPEDDPKKQVTVTMDELLAHAASRK